MEINFIKKPGGLVPSLDNDVEKFRRFKNGEVVKGEFTVPRNSAFHRKYMALLNIGYDAWNEDHKNKDRSFERFRKDIVILAGYYDYSFGPRGGMTVEAKSISFAKMNEEDFEKLYSKTINVLLEKILTEYTKDNLDDTVQQVLGFA